MDWYSLVKFLHVAASVVWVGGGFALMLVGTRAERTGNAEEMMMAMRAVADLGNVLFVPASIVTLLLGLVMCWFWVGFGELWIVLGLLGYAVTFLVGVLIFKPTGDRLKAMIEQGGLTPAAIAIGRRILRVARFDYAVMAVVVADMVLKPTVSDVGTLAAMALVLAVGAALAFGSFGEPAQAQA